MKKVNQLKAGVILSYLSLGISNIISILYTPIMLRLLGQSEYGLYNLSNCIIGYLGILDFGLGNAIIRYTAKYRAISDEEGESNLNGLFIIVYSIITLIVIIAGGIVVLNTNAFFFKNLSMTEFNRMKVLMSLMVFNLAISLPGGIFNGIITAYERFIFLRVLGIIRAILNPFIMLPLLLIGYKSVGMTIATTVINIVYIIVNMYYCFYVLKIKVKFKNMDFLVLKEIMAYSFYMFINIILDKIYWSTDQFILGFICGTTAVAIYSVGSTFNTYYINISTAISGVFLPKVTKMIVENATISELSKLFIKIGRIQYIILAFILSGFLIAGKEFISIWAGVEYTSAYYIAVVAMIPLTIPLIQNMGIVILQAKNRNKFRSYVLLIIAILNIILSIPLAKILGGFGCALASGICYVIGAVIVMNIYYYRCIEIDIPKFWRNIFSITLPILISLILGLCISKLINITGLLGIILKEIIFTVIYINLIWFVAMNEYEKQLFLKPLNKIKRLIKK